MILGNNSCGWRSLAERLGDSCGERHMKRDLRYLHKDLGTDVRQDPPIAGRALRLV